MNHTILQYVNGATYFVTFPKNCREFCVSCECAKYFAQLANYVVRLTNIVKHLQNIVNNLKTILSK